MKCGLIVSQGSTGTKVDAVTKRTCVANMSA